MLYFFVYYKDEVIKTYEFNNVPLLIGRLPENDIPIACISISRRHLSIEKDTQGQYIIKDLNSLNGTFINEKKITQDTLMHNDKITIGKYLIHFEITQNQVPILLNKAPQNENVQSNEKNNDTDNFESPQEPASNNISEEPPPEIPKESDNEDPQEFDINFPAFIEINKHIIYKLDKPLMSIGNSEKDDIFVDGFLISDEHVQIEKEDDGYYIFSKKIVGKLRVNGKKISKHKLCHKDKIEIGSNTFRFMEYGQKE